MRPWKLTELNLRQVREKDFEVAVLPLGAIEPHNLHLPYGMDLFEGDLIGERVCEEAYNGGAKVVLLPTIPFGTETNLAGMPLALNVNPSTLSAFITDIIESLAGHGVRKIVLLNSHGGNDLKPLLRELYGRMEAFLFLCDWYRMIGDIYGEIFDHPDDHAGEMETSIALAYFPNLVSRNENGSLSADEGEISTMRFEALNSGWVSITRPWHLLTSNSGVGNPHSATSEKGERIINVIVERLAPFLVELSEAEIDERFPFR